MPFDGVNYGGVPLIRPYSSHSRATATGAALGGSLAGAYLYSRQQGRLIGHQTYFHFLYAGWEYQRGGVRDYIQSTTPLPIAQFRRWVPAHATHIIAEVRFFAIGESAPTARHKVEATLSSTTTVGDQVEDLVTVNTYSEAYQRGQYVDNFDDGAIGKGIARCFVALPSGRASGTMTVSVKGCALMDPGSAASSWAAVYGVTTNAGLYRPDLVSAYWVCSG